MGQDLSQPEIPDDHHLALEARSGDDAAFAELVRRHKERIFRITFRFTRNDHDQEDLAQEIFIQAHRKLSTFRGDAPFEHWLMRMAHHRCCDWWRKHRRRNEDAVSADLLLEISDSGTERSLSREEARKVIDAALRDLSAEDRLVITLLELEERSVREISNVTGWSEGAVKVRAHRARKQMALNLEKTHGRK